MNKTQSHLANIQRLSQTNNNLSKQQQHHILTNKRKQTKHTTTTKLTSHITLKKHTESQQCSFLLNFNTIFDTMVKVKPAAAKGTYMKNVAITSTMGPSIKIDPSTVGK
jgi:ribosomal protein L1